MGFRQEKFETVFFPAQENSWNRNKKEEKEEQGTGSTVYISEYS